GAVFGALGAFLALPVTASLQAIFRVCTKQYSLVSSPLMNDPRPDHTSIIVRCVEAIGRKFMNPMSESVHRVMKGTSSRVSLNEDILYWYKQAYVSDSGDANGSKVSSNDSDQTDVLETMPISREILDAVNKDIANRKVDSENKNSPKAKLQVGESKIVNNTKNSKSNVKNNPRSGWKR
ncbi:AI-2E family transporter, partial [Bifidobacteriaceae bacterium NR015]